jgi:hypothetical protein
VLKLPVRHLLPLSHSNSSPFILSPARLLLLFTCPTRPLEFLWNWTKLTISRWTGTIRDLQGVGRSHPGLFREMLLRPCRPCRGLQVQHQPRYGQPKGYLQGCLRYSQRPRVVRLPGMSSTLFTPEQLLIISSDAISHYR